MSRNFDTVKPRFWVFLGAVLLIAAVVLYASQQRYIAGQDETIQALEAQRDELIALNAQLQEEIDFTYTDQYIEREARKLGLIRPDEVLFQSNDTNTMNREKED